MATHIRGTGEIAIAFRPEFMGTYIAQMEDLHRIGLSGKELALLKRIAADPDAVSDSKIDADTAPARRKVMASVRRAVRAYKFRARVLDAYRHRCAFCGIQLRLLDAAHILPVAHPGSVDNTANGIAACPLHHRAYDQALLIFDDKYRIQLNEESIAQLQAEDMTGGLDKFKIALLTTINLPVEPADHPQRATVREANKYRGWKFKATLKPAAGGTLPDPAPRD